MTTRVEHPQDRVSPEQYMQGLVVGRKVYVINIDVHDEHNLLQSAVRQVYSTYEKAHNAVLRLGFSTDGSWSYKKVEGEQTLYAYIFEREVE